MVVAEALHGSVRILIILIAVMPLCFMMKSIQTSSVLLALYLFALVLLNSMRDASIANSIQLLIPICIGFVVANSINLPELVKVYNNVMVFLAAYSIITFVLALLFPAFIQMLPLLGYRLDTKATMHNALFSVCISNAENVRNYGITWEPGAFSVLLCVSLYSILAFEDRINRTKLLILVVAIITTFSTMGYIVMAGFFLAFMLKQKDGSKKVRKLIMIFACAFLVLLIVLPSSITDIVFGKLSGLFSEGKDMAYTTLARLNAIKYPFIAFCTSPIVGVGYDKFAEINRTLCDGVATNTILNWFAVMGALLGVPCAYYYTKLVLKVSTHAQLSMLGKIIILFSAIILVSTESLLRISLMYIFIFYGCSNQLRKCKNENTVYTRSL